MEGSGLGAILTLEWWLSLLLTHGYKNRQPQGLINSVLKPASSTSAFIFFPQGFKGLLVVMLCCVRSVVL